MVRPVPVVALLLVSVYLSAAPAAAQVGGGVKGGVAFSSFLHAETADEEVQALAARPDFIVGGFVFGPSASAVSVQVEATYSRRGARLNGGGARVDFLLSYLDVSGLVRGTIARGASATSYLLGGVTTGFTISAERVTRVAGTLMDRTTIDDVISDLDVRLLVGVGAELRRVILEGRYSHGLRPVVANPDASSVAGSLKNRAFEILVGVRF